MGDTGIGDHGGKGSEFLDDVLDHVGDFGEAGDVGDGDGGFLAHVPDLLGDCFGEGLVGGNVVDCDVVAVVREAEGDGAADSLRGAGDDCYSGHAGVSAVVVTNEVGEFVGACCRDAISTKSRNFDGLSVTVKRG